MSLLKSLNNSVSVRLISLVSRPRPYHGVTIIEKCKVAMDKRNGIRLIAAKPIRFLVSRIGKFKGNLLCPDYFVEATSLILLKINSPLNFKAPPPHEIWLGRIWLATAASWRVQWLLAYWRGAYNSRPARPQSKDVEWNFKKLDIHF